MKIASLLISTLIVPFVALANGLDGKALKPASDAALIIAASDVGADAITSWSSTLGEREVVVEISTNLGSRFLYSCNYDGAQMGCEECSLAPMNLEKDASPSNLEFIQEGHEAALIKLEKTLKRQGLDLSVMKALKVWTHEDSHHGHSHGTDVWTKINYLKNGEPLEVFLICHTHGEESDLSCHFSKSGEGEPL